MSKYKCYDFIEKVIEKYNKKHKIFPERFWENEDKLIECLNKKYNNTRNIVEIYITLHFLYKRNITSLPIYSARDYLLILKDKRLD